MSRDRRGESSQGTAGASAASAPAAIGKTTLTQALPLVPAPGRDEGASSAEAAPATERQPESAADPATSAPKQHAAYDISPLFGPSSTASGTPVQRAVASPIPSAETAKHSG